MHIPSHAISNEMVAATSVIAAALVATSAVFAARAKDKPSLVKVAAATAFVLAVQMMNYTSLYGVASHIIGMMFLVIMLGVPFAVLSMTSVLTVQALVLGDGSISTLGVNIITMAFISLIPYFLMKKRYFKLGNKDAVSYVIIALATLISFEIACIATAVFMAIANGLNVSKVALDIMSIQMLPAVIEMSATAAAVFLFSRISEKQTNIALFASSVVFAVTCGFTSSLPDMVFALLQTYEITYSEAVSLSSMTNMNEILAMFIALLCAVGLSGALVKFTSVKTKE